MQLVQSHAATYLQMATVDRASIDPRIGRHVGEQLIAIASQQIEQAAKLETHLGAMRDVVGDHLNGGYFTKTK